MQTKWQKKQKTSQTSYGAGPSFVCSMYNIISLVSEVHPSISLDQRFLQLCVISTILPLCYSWLLSKAQHNLLAPSTGGSEYFLCHLCIHFKSLSISGIINDVSTSWASKSLNMVSMRFYVTKYFTFDWNELCWMWPAFYHLTTGKE